MEESSLNSHLTSPQSFNTLNNEYLLIVSNLNTKKFQSVRDEEDRFEFDPQSGKLLLKDTPALASKKIVQAEMVKTGDEPGKNDDVENDTIHKEKVSEETLGEEETSGEEDAQEDDEREEVEEDEGGKEEEEGGTPPQPVPIRSVGGQSSGALNKPQSPPPPPAPNNAKSIYNSFPPEVRMEAVQMMMDIEDCSTTWRNAKHSLVTTSLKVENTLDATTKLFSCLEEGKTNVESAVKNLFKTIDVFRGKMEDSIELVNKVIKTELQKSMEVDEQATERASHLPSASINPQELYVSVCQTAFNKMRNELRLKDDKLKEKDNKIETLEEKLFALQQNMKDAEPSSESDLESVTVNQPIAKKRKIASVRSGQEKTNDNEKPEKCLIKNCNSRFVGKNAKRNLYRHYGEVHFKTSFKCPQIECLHTKGFFTQQSLNQHYTREHPKNNVPDIVKCLNK